MPMRIAHLKIALFAFILAAPILAWMGFGNARDYGGGPHPNFPSIGQMLTKRGQLDKFGNAMLHRSPAMRQAVRLRGWVGYRLVGFVDTGRVVSGEMGWLFYRSEFHAGACLDEDMAARKLAEFAALTDLARAAGIDMIMSVAADKSTIYPEYLSRLARGYWRCQEHDVPLLRRLIREQAPLLVDHSEPILAAKAAHPEIPLYYTTDTHWTPYGAALGLRQLLEAAFPVASIPQPTLSDTMASRATDLSRMLLLPQIELRPIPDPAWQAGLRAFNRDAANVRTLIIHDSFYALLRGQLAAIFPNLVTLGFRSTESEIDAAIASTDRLIISSVERLLFSRMTNGGLGWDGKIGRALLKRNRTRAESCGGFAPAAIDAGLSAAMVSGAVLDGGSNGDRAIAVPAGATEQLPCLRLALSDPKPAALEIFLPDAKGAFVPGRSVKVGIGPDDWIVTLVLPDNVAGAGIRIRMTGGNGPASLGAVEIGAVARRLATAAP